MTEPAPAPAAGSHRCPGRVGIVGLGLIGGSLGLDLQAAGWAVQGIVRSEATARRARERGLATRVDTDPAALTGCGLVVLALPLDRLLAPPAALVAALPREAVVTDVGSVKAPVLALWQDLHPRFVAGHPMAGTAAAGVEAGLPGLFRSRPWVITPGPRTDPGAIEALERLAEAVGAEVITAEAATHDRAAALISHLPVLVSASLLLAAADESDAGVAALARQLASSGFADTTRVGGGNPDLGTLMARTNGTAVLAALRRCRHQLEAIEQLVQDGGWPDLHSALSRAGQERSSFRGCG
ncbi:prephenate/arogenate dehydrogenase [Synechococcus sp. RSCCF101]|uniref:prephenate/arogenate dehydrogenase n=1 Tax=Synechococcus sp. RSCCF101 TaxID=2511069 RepID=UPI00124461F4|nr:prephenate/arogenate dehydrogenase [Synechococcus sp. RSCCF101]QEY32162.1 prephenate/arogenate dehydrogenase [Synechococcus sp. RSCCF101]